MKSSNMIYLVDLLVTNIKTNIRSIFVLLTLLHHLEQIEQLYILVLKIKNRYRNMTNGYNLYSHTTIINILYVHLDHLP